MVGSVNCHFVSFPNSIVNGHFLFLDSVPLVLIQVMQLAIYPL